MTATDPSDPASDDVRFLEDLIERSRARAHQRLTALRAEHPNLTRHELAERLVRAYAHKAGLGGAATGALSIVSLPLGLPVGLGLTLALEAELLLGLLDLYEIDPTGVRGRAPLYALWAGSGVVDAAKSIGLRMGADAVGRIIAGSLPARVIARLNPLLMRLVLRRLGLGWLPRLMKFWPVVGAPIGYVVDSTAIGTLGRTAIAHLESLPRHPPVVQEEPDERDRTIH